MEGSKLYEKEKITRKERKYLREKINKKNKNTWKEEEYAKGRYNCVKDKNKSKQNDKSIQEGENIRTREKDKGRGMDNDRCLCGSNKMNEMASAIFNDRWPPIRVKGALHLITLLPFSEGLVFLCVGFSMCKCVSLSMCECIGVHVGLYACVCWF